MEQTHMPNSKNDTGLKPGLFILFSNADGKQKPDGDVVGGLRERVARPWPPLRAVAELWDVVGRSGTQIVRPSSNPTQHIPGTIPWNEGKKNLP